ncbi:transcriptional regulator [Marinobacterium nitratireducens]|uniref:Transcriptional regulator n=1 Tax=Marinobacterium nitratireducens TaxID=518897 RepID=A0A917ZLU3_9GAMM|nr:GntR family transcriptional regulator [Marinobacterium nitratireducens]GGO86151.1 transcriptional regulator [Marinobacterium nitratireducens]
MTKTKRKPSDDEVYNRIWSAIMERKLQPGTRLKEEDLCEVFETSRGGIRKVLQRLAHHNLINLVPNSGAYVAKATVKEAREVFQARRLIETELVRELVRTFTPAKRQALEEHVALEEQAHRDGDLNRRIRLSGEFHLKIGELADKQVLTHFLREIVSRTSLIIAQYQLASARHAEETAAHPCCEHRGLIEAFEKRDADGAISLMMEHLCHLEEQLDLASGINGAIDLKSIFS